MKYKTTKKDVMERTKSLYCGYCDYQTIFNRMDANAYTCGVYGWNANIYELPLNFTIVTGYRPFGEVRFDLTKEEELRLLNLNFEDGEPYSVYEAQLKWELAQICKRLWEEKKND